MTEKLKIVSHSGGAFQDRVEAGRLLADELAEYAGRNVLVLGIPRGGVVVGRELAHKLDGELDVILARKLRTPGREELAMGAIAEDGTVFMNEQVIRMLGVDARRISEEKSLQMAEIGRRARLIRKVRPRVPIKGRTVIVTDDGVATGATTEAALWAVRQAGPKMLIAAMPVGSDDTVRRLSEEVDQMICLRAPRFFEAVGQFYLRFHPVSDDEVLDILRDEQKRNVAGGSKRGVRT
jgi:putative phosphoribosyl transferase